MPLLLRPGGLSSGTASQGTSIIQDPGWQADTMRELKALELKGQRMQHAVIGQPHLPSPVQCAMGAGLLSNDCALPAKGRFCISLHSLALLAAVHAPQPDRICFSCSFAPLMLSGHIDSHILPSVRHYACYTHDAERCLDRRRGAMDKLQ